MDRIIEVIDYQHEGRTYWQVAWVVNGRVYSKSGFETREIAQLHAIKAISYS